MEPCSLHNRRKIFLLCSLDNQGKFCTCPSRLKLSIYLNHSWITWTVVTFIMKKILGLTFGGVLIKTHKKLTNTWKATQRFIIPSNGFGDPATSSNIKSFSWLLLKDRLNVRGMLRRRTMLLDNYTCVLCPCQEDETIEHLFLNCPFAQQCWSCIGLQIQLHLDPMAILVDLGRQIAESFFMEVIMLMSWSIWTSCNNFIFKN